MKFWNWEIADSSPKIEKAKSAELTPLGIEKELPFAVFSGKCGIYNTTDKSCNCYSFSSSEPCKHIIRLALECGEADGVFENNIDSVIFPRERVVTKTLYVDTSTGAASDEKPVKDGVLNGAVFAITGTLDISREEATALIASNGGKVTGAVSSKTDYLLCGEDAGSKLTKANALGVKVISLDDLKHMIEEY